MRFLVGSDLVRIGRNRGVAERHLASAQCNTGTAGAGQQVRRQPDTGRGIGIELRLQIFEVQREIEDVSVRQRRLGIGARNSRRHRQAAAGHCRHCECLKEIAALCASLGPSFEYLEHFGVVIHGARLPG